MTKEGKQPRKAEVFTLLVQVGRSENDGLPSESSGAGLLCYTSGFSEDEAVRETVNILRQADLNPLDVTGYGTLAEQEAEGTVIDDQEKVLMKRALEENSVIVAQLTPLYANDA